MNTTTLDTMLDWALHYAKAGFEVFPVSNIDKAPFVDNGFKDATSDPATITNWWQRTPLALVACRVPADVVILDIDPRHGGDSSLAELEASYGPLRLGREHRSGRDDGGRHIWFARPDVTLSIKPLNEWARKTGTGHAVGKRGWTCGIDILHHNSRYTILPPSLHPDTHHPYTWHSKAAPTPMAPWLAALLTKTTPTSVPSPPLQRSETDSIADWYTANHSWNEILGNAGWVLVEGDGDSDGSKWRHPNATAASSCSIRHSCLFVYTPNTDFEQTEEGDTRGYTRFRAWATLEHDNQLAVAARAARETKNGYGYTPPPFSTVTKPGPAPVVNQPYTPLGNARRLVAAHGEDFRHVPQWAAWLTWDGTRWIEDHTGDIHRHAKQVIDGFHTMIGTITDSDERKKLFKWWMTCQASAGIGDMLNLARTEPGIPVLVEQLDADPWTLNTRGGAVDLNTGNVAPSARRALCTKLAPVDIDPFATCPQWEAFIDWAMCGDPELVAFLQRAVGYTLTGSVNEQVLFFCHGLGSNGKSTFLAVLSRILGDYAFSAEADLLLAVTHERHSTGIADLHGRRMVIAQEIDEGRRLDEALVKRLTGGDIITARRMRQDNFMFTPTHKLWMAANHKPVVRGTDHAIWRRIRLIPFLATIADADKDDGLTQRLLTEAPGILQWALRGCAKWSTNGLQAPQIVTEATQSYRSEQDHIGRFIDECCTLDPNLTITTKDLRTAYEKWCFDTGEQAWKAPAMAAQLQDRGCTPDRQSGGNRTRIWRGIALSGDAANDLSDRQHAMDWAERSSGEYKERSENASQHVPPVDKEGHRDAKDTLSVSPAMRAHHGGKPGIASQRVPMSLPTGNNDDLF